MTKLLLWILNSRWLNNTPCRYGFINNIDAFSIEHLRSEARQQPGITVEEVIQAAEMFKACPIRKSGVTVIENDGYREATEQEIESLTRIERE